MREQPSLTKTEEKLLAIVRDFLIKSESEGALSVLRTQSLNADIEKELGIGSLERAELFDRVEKAFGIQFPDAVIARTVTLKDVVMAIENANPPSRILYQDFFPIPEKSEVDPSICETFVEVLVNYAQNEPHRIHIYLQDEHGNETAIRYGHLYQSALDTAKGLHAMGLQPKETVAIMLPTGEEFFYAFFGILLAGGVPVPIYPPFRPDRIEEYARREAKILSNAEVRILISFSEVQTLNKLLRNFIPSLKAVTTVQTLIASKNNFAECLINSEDPALIQYTSGSTGDPKGVLLSHQNLLANIRAIKEGLQITPSDVGISWLPLYHDMGLIGSWLGCLYFGIPVTIMSPLSFLNHPERWLWAIHYHRGTVTGGPNFAYELCVSKIDDKSIEGLDLSSWRAAFNGAEAVHPKTIQKFIKRFAPYGLRAESFFPVYGLAESTVALTFPPLNRGVRFDRISREIFNKEQIAASSKPDEKNYIEFVSCGSPLPKHDVRIVNEAGEEVAERVVGELQFCGPSSMQGYYRNPSATKAIYHEGWYSSGDLAYKVDNEIFITGRKKDIIVKAGRNLYPQEIEEITGQVNGIRKGCVIAFGVINPKRGTEQLIVVAETKESHATNKEKIIKEVVESITVAIGDPPDRVVLVPPRKIPKTSSGKLQRSACKELYLQGKLTRRATPPWIQITKLFFISGLKKAGKALTKFIHFLYTLYVSLLFVITAIPALILIYLSPREFGAKVIRFWARNLFRLAGCPVKVMGQKRLQKNAMIFVANHGSYLDTILLVAILPSNIRVVGKRELTTIPVVRGLIKKLDHPTVRRLDFNESISDTHTLHARLQTGQSLLIFPEGTFSYATGLRPFKLGAFKLAVENQQPLCPIALQGTRYILRSGSFLLRPGRIKIWIGKPITPKSDDWNESIRLRSVIRNKIAMHCGEQMIDLISAAPAKR